MHSIYLVVFQEGDVHKLDECPSEEALSYDDTRYIRITYSTESDIKLEFYSVPVKSWVEITQ